MRGRDPHQDGRAATNLELFYDLVFVVAFSTAGTQLAHALSEGHYRVAILGYVFGTFAAIWAWINFAWFASAFDTDDWFFRLATLVQMIGVAVIAIGIPPLFTSLEHGQHFDNRVLVIGYIVMRVGMVAQWIRAAIQSPENRRAAITYAAFTLIAQIGWIAVAVADMAVVPAILGMLACSAVELLGPLIAERGTSGTPWHPHHIAERYSLLTIITLGEGVVGTVAVLSAIIQTQGWSMSTAILGLAGMGVTFAMWWIYFMIPVGEALHGRRRKSFGFGYGHIVIFMAAASVGAGLHVAALYIEHESHIGVGAVVATLAVPLGIYCLGLIVLYTYLMGSVPLVFGHAAAVLVFLVAGVWIGSATGSVVAGVVVTCLAPVAMVLIDEFGGARHRAERLQVLEQEWARA